MAATMRGEIRIGKRLSLPFPPKGFALFYFEIFPALNSRFVPNDRDEAVPSFPDFG
jgi:hypothetical protein